jgi:glycosyltransferase involved in cell wall biosynthesis
MGIVERTRKETNPFLSIILPSRKRVEMLNETLYSIYSLADLNNPNFEIIIKVDFDDHETLDYIKNWSNEYENLHFIINSRKKGFLNLVDFLEDMMDLAKGKYILVANDDMIFKTQNWNTILNKCLTDFKVYFPYVNGYRESFWCIPKELYTVLGHIAPHNQTDTYLSWLGQVLGIVEYIDDIELYHKFDYKDETASDKIDVIDINYASRNYHRNSPEFKEDIKILQKHLGIEKLNPITKN